MSEQQKAYLPLTTSDKEFSACKLDIKRFLLHFWSGVARVDMV